MVSPGSPALRKLHCLDASPPDFGDRVCDILYGNEYVQAVPNLEGDDPVWLIDYLDKVLNGLEPSSAASRKCLRELRSVCGTTGILPTSCMLPSQPLEISPEPFTAGGYGDMYKGTLNGSTVCIKRLRVYTSNPHEMVLRPFCQEAVMWKRLTHPNIMPLLGVSMSPLQLVSDWMPAGDLPKYIKGHPDADLVGLLAGVAGGLCYLHSCSVIHGDLKGANILVDESGRTQITDFGLAMVTKNLDSLRGSSDHHGNTPRWSAPEVLSEGAHSKEADTFSFAMVMIEVFTGNVPFRDSSSIMAILAITQGKRPPRPTHPMFTGNLWSLMQRCWDHDPHSRPEISEALEILLAPGVPAWKQLIEHALTTDERISLIVEIFSDHSQITMVRNIHRDDAQKFVDVVDQVFDRLPTETLRQCLPTLHFFGDSQALVPRSLKIPLCYDRMENPVCRGLFADVWKGRHHDQEVAARVFRVYSTSDVEDIRSKFCREVAVWRVLNHPNVVPLVGVTTTENRFVMVSEWSRNGNINEFVRANPDVNRLALLGDATRGLVYLHDLGIIHGDLKGMRILIDSAGRARLSGFRSLEAISDRPSVSRGAPRWMAPELLDQEQLSHCTKESDCYSLGMVIYEVLSGEAPFASTHRISRVIADVIAGVKPSRPQGTRGVWFTDSLWEVLKRCWRREPGDRPSIETVLLCLQGTLQPSGVDEYVGINPYTAVGAAGIIEWLARTSWEMLINAH